MVKSSSSTSKNLPQSHQEGCDLIAMFTDGPQSLGEVIFGSTTQRVLKGIDIDLLSVRK